MLQQTDYTVFILFYLHLWMAICLITSTPLVTFEAVVHPQKATIQQTNKN